MPGGKHGNTLVDDDFDDFDEDDYLEEEEEESDPAPTVRSAYRPPVTGNAQPAQPQIHNTAVNELLGQLIPGLYEGQPPGTSSQGGSAAWRQQQQAGLDGYPTRLPAGGSCSALGKFLSGPPPLRLSGRVQKAGRQQLAAQIAQQAAQAPPQHPAASEVQRFQFDRPSPDDLVQRAQIQRGAGASDQSWLSELSTSSPAGFAMPPAQPQYRPPMASVAAQSATKAAELCSGQADSSLSAPSANGKLPSEGQSSTRKLIRPCSHPIPLKSAPPPIPDWQSSALGDGRVELDEDGWQKLPVELEVRMLQEAAGPEGVAGLQIEERPQERWWKGAASGSRPDAENEALSLREAARTSQRSRSVTPVKRRPLSEYKMEPDLQRMCDEAAKEEEGALGGRSKLHLVVLGHVDAGKSTLMGRLLHELGYVSQRVVHRHQKEAAQMGKASFAWAWLLDERPQERARGVTIDVGSAHFETGRHAVTLLDAPGHRDFVPNMIAGAAQADAALLLVDGSKGNFEAGFEATAGFGSLGGGQTREHAQLARSFGVDQMAVVVSKLDTCDFSQARFEEIRAQLLPFLKQCGFREANLQWLPAVGTLNENLTAPPRDPRLAAWWEGPTLVQAIDAFRSGERKVALPLRLPINDVFKGDRGGQSVGGKLEAGAIKVGTRVKVMPSGEEGTIKSIEMHGRSVDLARAGDGADVTLTNIDAAVLGAGAVICHPDFPVPLVSRVEARIAVLDVGMPIVMGQQVTLHAHAARETGHISQLLAVVNPKTGEQAKRKPRVLTKGQSAVVEVTVTRPTCLELYAECRALGRLVLREGGQTLAVGIITAILE